MTLTQKFYSMYPYKTYKTIFDEIKNDLNSYPKNEAIDALNDLHAQVSCDIYFGEPKSLEVINESETLIKEINSKIEAINNQKLKLL